jgi:hypothetical protein
MTLTLRSRLAAIVMCLVAFAGPSRADDSQPLCAPSLPGCVISNWGQVEPDSIDSAAVGTNARIASIPTGRIAMQVQPTAASTRARASAAGSGPTVKTVVSPTNLFPRETQALVAAIQRARFHRDGSIAKGGDAIAAAAAELARKADAKYTLTLYVKTPKGIRPDESSVLFKKVDAVNAAIGGSSAPGRG